MAEKEEEEGGGESHHSDVEHYGSFDEEQFAAFVSAIEEIGSKKNVVRDFRKSKSNADDLATVRGHLLNDRRRLPRWGVERFLPPPTTKANDDGGSRVEIEIREGGGADVRDDDDDAATVNDNDNEGAAHLPLPHTKRLLRERSLAYLSRTGLSSSQHKVATVLLAHLADHCAKTSDPAPLRVAWEKVLEMGIAPLSRTLSTYLYVLGLDDGNDGGGGDGDARGRDVPAEVAAFHDALYEPTEKTVTLLVKSLVARGDARGAEALLDGISSSDGGPLGSLRHRTTSPILKLYCDSGEIDSALRLYRRMRETSRVKMDEATYADFVAAVAANGYFRPDAECIVGAEELLAHGNGDDDAAGGEAPCGPGLLDALLTEMAEDVLEISEESARALHDGFVRGFVEVGGGNVDDSGGPGKVSDDGATEGWRPITAPLESRTLVADRVAIDAATARCTATGTTLRLIVLEPSQRKHVHDTLLDMAAEKSREYTARLAARGRSTRDNAEKAEAATRILREFSEWMDGRDGEEPYTVIVDGANVAYFGWGRVNVHQLAHMVNALEKQGERPLVVFPEKYTRRKFHLRQGMMQVLRDEEMGLLEGLREKGQMYVVPPMCLDDLYWMLASVSNQTASANGRNIDVPKNNAEGRFPGLRPMVITNDKMRDHKMELLEERAFRRWCCSHIVNYNFTEYIENQSDERTISFCAADVFSDEIQGNPCPGEGGDAATAWHFPVSEWDKNERFCLRLPS